MPATRSAAAPRPARPLFAIAWQNPNRYPEAAARKLRPWLARLLPAVLARHGRGGEESPELAVRFASDRELQRVNRTFRGKDAATDVLSFPGEAAGWMGDILISVPSARRQAAAARHSVDRELRILLLHGLLHCLGFDHERDRGQMTRLERRLRSRYLGSRAHG
jgi:probable rRNA maturation factor